MGKLIDANALKQALIFDPDFENMLVKDMRVVLKIIDDMPEADVCRNEKKDQDLPDPATVCKALEYCKLGKCSLCPYNDNYDCELDLHNDVVILLNPEKDK